MFDDFLNSKQTILDEKNVDLWSRGQKMEIFKLFLLEENESTIIKLYF